MSRDQRGRDIYEKYLETKAMTGAIKKLRRGNLLLGNDTRIVTPLGMAAPLSETTSRLAASKGRTGDTARFNFNRARARLKNSLPLPLLLLLKEDGKSRELLQSP